MNYLSHSDIPKLVEAFARCNWHKPTSLFEQYLHEQEMNKRLIWVAYEREEIAGYITLIWQSGYPSFQKQDIPEIKDLNVLPSFRNHGIGNALLGSAEAAAWQRGNVIGLAVGLYADYGAAQRIYVKRGYIPDGRGITYDHQTVPPGEHVCLDDDLVLWMTKRKQAV